MKLTSPNAGFVRLVADATEKWPKTKAILLAGAALATLSVSPAAALSLSGSGQYVLIPYGSGQDILYSELRGIRDRIRVMPFVKADAYMAAINEYCFPEEELKNDDLESVATTQGIYGEQDLLKAHEKAETHLRGDQNACSPARDFVERVIDELPETRLALDQFVPEYRLIEAAIAALDEADAVYEEQQAEEKAANQKREAALLHAEAVKRQQQRHIEDCASYADVADISTPEWQKQPHARIVQLNSKSRQIKSCGDVFSAAEIAAKISAHKALEDKIRAELSGETREAVKAGKSYECKFKGLAKIIISVDRNDASLRWLTIGKAEPVRYFVGNIAGSAKTADGKQVTIYADHIELDGKSYQGSCSTETAE
ncbi:hypothetical protein I6F26_10235 [Ensifer sp. IC3342]|nr:hypothetical protein [Ensifer sp. BRP08]MCA1446957.1 hypothetical protein [Ensifer sp. IC3342]